jgi:hypothetical protein
MKSTYSRRYRRNPSTKRDSGMFKKDSQEHAFFSGPANEHFFKPNLTIQRKCAHCEAEDKSVKRMGDNKEDDKKVQKMEEKKEEKPVQKMEEKKEEKPVQKQEEKKEEKPVQKQEEKKEEKPVQKMEEKKEEKPVQKQEEKEEKPAAAKQMSPSQAPHVVTSSYIDSIGGKGQALPEQAKHYFSKKMDYDFSNVKVHTGSDAERSAKEVNAKAYTVDNHIVFNKGQFNPRSEEGKRLLAHELTHVIQQKEKKSDILQRVTDNIEKQKEEEKTHTSEGHATNTKNKTAYGCAGVSVQGQTDANYTDSYKTSGTTKPSEKCTDCTPPDCINASGLIVSVFKANPVITLPDVPDGLSECETRAVSRFIHGTLKRHEQQHVAAFNTYNGVVRTPYSFTGCQGELDAYMQSKHDDINTLRQDAANARSNALDPFNPTIPCNCPDQ